MYMGVDVFASAVAVVPDHYWGAWSLLGYRAAGRRTGKR